MNMQRKLKLAIWLIIPLCVLLFAAVFTGKMHHRAGEIGAAAGQSAGSAVGWAIGSADGIINGTKAGKEAGKEAGLSAEDTTVDIKGGITAIGKLEVLAANVSMKNNIEVGKDYKGVEVINGDIVFTVDFSKARISFSRDGETAYITLPKPEHEIYVNEEKSNMLFEFQKRFFGKLSAKYGQEAYINSRKTILERGKDAIDNYESLREEAEASAQKQVELLVSTLCGSSYSVQVNFK